MIDLNSDLGEGDTDDEALLQIVTSANVACGAHAGSRAIMRAVCTLAVARGVAIGAHVSYPDRENFGRTPMALDVDALREVVASQIAELSDVAASCGAEVAYVKPHGALYNTIVTDEEQAAAVVAACGSLPVMGLPGSAVLRLAPVGVPEAFADRAYAPDGSLVPRWVAGSVLHDVEEITARCVRLAVDGRVRTIDGDDIEVVARSLCVHGDTPGAVAIARAVREALTAAGVALAPFAPGQ